MPRSCPAGTSNNRLDPQISRSSRMFTSPRWGGGAFMKRAWSHKPNNEALLNWLVRSNWPAFETSWTRSVAQHLNHWRRWERLVNVHLTSPFVRRLIATGPCLNARSRSITEEMQLRCLLDHKGKRPGKEGTANMNMAWTCQLAMVHRVESQGKSGWIVHFLFMPVLSRVRHKSADSVPHTLGGRASEWLISTRRFRTGRNSTVLFPSRHNSYPLMHNLMH